MTRYVGIDPGRRGAAVLLAEDGTTVLDLQVWRSAAVPPALRFVEPGDVVALEAQYMGRSARSSLVLSEWCGRLLAALPACTVLRPLASEWRAKVFRRARMRRDVAKALAVKAATPHFLAAGWTDVRDDECEAWAMARYAWGAVRAGVVT